MKKSISILFLGFCLILGSIDAGICEDATNQPAAKSEKPEKYSKIVFEELVYDFGEVSEGEQVTHIYKFKNEGNSTLKINNVRTSCGCTAALVTEDTLEPTKKGEIKVTFNTKRRKGNQSKRITVRSNDPEQSVVSLTIKGVVKVEVDIYPDTIFFGQIKKNQGLIRDIKILPSSQKDFKVLSVTSSNPLITTELSDFQEGDKKGNKLFVRLSKDFKPGRVRESIIIKTNNPKIPESRISISGRILGDISYTPSSLTFISSSVGVRNVRRVSLVNSGDIPLKIEEVKIDGSEFTHEIKSFEEGKRLEITLTFNPNDKTITRISKKLIIKTNIPDQPLIEIPVYTSIRQGQPVRKPKGSSE